MTLIIEVSCRGVEESRRLLLKEGEELVVGRENKKVVLRTDQTLSRRHFALAYADKEIKIKHLSRTNPTLMAPEGSSEFQRITESRSERNSCRIIAGAHRFVAMIETPESATISGSIDEIWGDVADEVDIQKLEPVRKGNLNSPELATLEEFLPGEESEEPVFTWEDSVNECSETPTIVEQDEKLAKSKKILPNGPAEIPAEQVPKQRQRKEPSKPDETQIDEGQDSFPDDFFD